MKCEEIGELLPDYLQGRLRADQAAEVEKHLAECAACGEEAALWKKLALLPEEQPSPALESRFKAMLESYQEGRWEKRIWHRRKVRRPSLYCGDWVTGDSCRQRGSFGQFSFWPADILSASTLIVAPTQPPRRSSMICVRSLALHGK